MRGAIPPLPNTPSWRGAQLKKSTGTTLPYLYLYQLNVRLGNSQRLSGRTENFLKVPASAGIRILFIQSIASQADLI